MTHLNWSFGEISLQLKFVNNFDKKLYYGVLNLSRLLFQIHILLAIPLLVYSINPSIVLLSSIYIHPL